MRQIVSTVGWEGIDIGQRPVERQHSYASAAGLRKLLTTRLALSCLICLKTNMRVRSLISVPIVGIFALLPVVAPRGSWGQPDSSFAIDLNGKPVGTADYSFTPKAGGYDSTSVVHVAMEGLNYALSKNEDLSASRSLVHVQLSAIVNGSAVSVVAKPDAAQLLLNISANGTSSTGRLASHKFSIFLADFDPGALQTLLDLAAGNNNRDLWAIIPKQAGTIEPIQLATYPDEHGSLNGKPIEVHHLVATIAGAATDLFAGPDNQLLQAELSQQGFALVRKGFVLTPPAKPLTPMASPAQSPPAAPAQAPPQQ